MKWKIRYENPEHLWNAAVGEGSGQITLDFNEMTRMIKVLDQNSGNDSGDKIPQGKIEITYDMTKNPQTITTVFKNGFTFDEDGIFENEKPTVIMRSAGENYLHFFSGNQFLNDKDDDGSDPYNPLKRVQFCNLDKYIKDIPLEDYLTTPSETHLQLIWTDTPVGKKVPDDYTVRITSKKGGAHIYGDFMVEGAVNASSESSDFRFWVPRCAELQDIDLKEPTCSKPTIIIRRLASFFTGPPYLLLT